MVVVNKTWQLLTVILSNNIVYFLRKKCFPVYKLVKDKHMVLFVLIYILKVQKD